MIILVDGAGFEPAKAEPADLQSAPFSHSGTHPFLRYRLSLNAHLLRCSSVHSFNVLQYAFTRAPRRALHLNIYQHPILNEIK
jgi:hypothetical protein